jgi:hypothetical protein
VSLDDELDQLMAEALERCANKARTLRPAALSLYLSTAVPDLLGRAWPLVRAALVRRFGGDGDIEGEIALALMARMCRGRKS